MSDLKSKSGGIRFVAVAEAPKASPGRFLLFLGVVFPAIVILVELVSKLCAGFVFDPLRTPWHVLAVASVPIINAMLWVHLRHERKWPARWLAFASGAAIAVAGFYTLLFAPLLPLATLGIMAYGLGLLAYGPLASFIAALLLRRGLGRRHAGLGRSFAGGLVLGAVALLVLDLPPAATKIGMQWAASGDAAERQRGIALLRSVGSEDYLRRLCYDARTRDPGLLSWLVAVANGLTLGRQMQALVSSPAEAREIYYRVYGQPFNLKPAPVQSGPWVRFADFETDGDLGGTEVGGRVRGLTLAASRIDGSISADDGLAYLEWIVEFRNSSVQQREARLEFALPPGGVVSRATLWVNGEEREAAYGGRGEVRRAYEQVAVRQRQDPLLVTTKGADRVLAQAFPVPIGGTIKFKIGITAPLDPVDASSARLTLPAILDRNFSFAPNVPHALWIEAKSPITASTPLLATMPVDGGLYRLRGDVTDEMLSRARQSITVSHADMATARIGRIGEGETVRQDWSLAPVKPGALMLVVDGSVKMAGARSGLIKALDAIPEGAKVGVTLAKEPPEVLAIAPWSQERKQAALDLIGKAAFAGGENNGPALSQALLALEAEPDALLLWAHGPQPVAFRHDAEQLAQLSERLKRFAQVVLYSLEPGPNQLLPDTPWAWAARTLPQTGDAGADLSGFLKGLWSEGAPRRSVRTQVEAGEGLAAGSEHIARLWARDRVLAMMQENPVANRPAATTLATRYRLITPVSGAVVLETQAQYAENRLTPAGQTSVPTVPEPHEWALLIMGALAFLWLAARRRGMGLRAA